MSDFFSLMMERYVYYSSIVVLHYTRYSIIHYQFNKHYTGKLQTTVRNQSCNFFYYFFRITYFTLLNIITTECLLTLLYYLYIFF